MILECLDFMSVTKADRISAIAGSLIIGNGCLGPL